MALQRSSRRLFLQSSVAASALITPAWFAPVHGADNKPRIKVAAIFTELRHRSHAYNFLMNMLGRCLFRGEYRDLGLDVVSFYADQFPTNDMAREVSKRFRVPLFKTIDEALCVGGKDLACDAVLLVGEHGDYPDNALGQRMYPRKAFFDQIVRTMRRCERFVPIFNDKHLSYRWDWSKEMYDEARDLKIPLMAGSSVPLGERRPMLELPGECDVKSAVSIHGGGMEVYDFHAFEVAQSFLERRRGGELGVKSVQLISGDAFASFARSNDWPLDLVAVAMQAEQQAGMTRQSRPIQSTGKPHPEVGDHALLIEHRDGLKSVAYKHGKNHRTVGTLPARLKTKVIRKRRRSSMVLGAISTCSTRSATPSPTSSALANRPIPLKERCSPAVCSKRRCARTPLAGK